VSGYLAKFKKKMKNIDINIQLNSYLAKFQKKIYQEYCRSILKIHCAILLWNAVKTYWSLINW